MKDDVTYRALSHYCDKVTVGHVGTTSVHYRDTGIAFLRTQNIGSGDLILDDLKYVTPEFHSSLKKSQLLPGDVLLTRVVTDVMKCGVVPEDIGEANCANVILIRPKPGLLPQYLYYMINSPEAQIYLLGKRVGSAQQVVNTKVLKEWPVRLPPLDEQKRIVAVLDQAFAALDRARAHAESNLADAEALYQATIEELFAGRTAWPSEDLNARVRFVDYRGKTPPKRETGVRLITAKNVRMGFIREEPREFILETAYDEWMTRGFPEVGDVLFTTEAPLANVAELDTDEKVVIGQRLITMKTDRDQIAPRFLKWSLMSPQMQKDVRDKGTGATVTGIKASLLKKIPFYVPPSIEDQNAIAEKCEAAFAFRDSLTNTFERKLANLSNLRQSLLQQAFSGQLTA